MSRLINADKLKKDILDLPDCYNGFSDTYDKACIIGVVDEQPTIERKKGKWIDETFEPWGPVYHPYKCNQCGEHSEANSNYCPNCGARMER